MSRFARTLMSLAATPLLALAVAAQSANPLPSQASVLQTGTALVIVDVVVQDSAGHPIHGLKPENFQLTEDHVAQTVNHFDEHTRAQAAAGPAIPKLPPGTFTDYTPVPPGGALNILLLDALNTPMKDQSFVRYQLQQYVKHAAPGTRIAIFGLATRLVMLQGFTSNPETLKDAVEHKLIPRSSPLLADPNDPANDAMDDMMQSQEAAANLTQFQAEQAAMETHLRLQYTLDAMNVLGHYLAAFPGRKNLIWFSGSFPINILPDASLQDPFAIVQVDEDEFRETTNLLAQAQVAVYPIDARGLMTNPVFDASNSGRQYARRPNAFGNAVMKFSTSQAQEHATMSQMATDTGGEAFYNTNGLAEAVEKAIEAGSNYYTLAYTPTNRKQDGGYRQIRVQLAGGDTNSAWKLSYRHGYYAGAKHTDKHAETAAAPGNAAGTGTASPASVAQHTAEAYAHAAMARGAPTPEDILFKVRVLPASTATEPHVAPDNDVSPDGKVPGPFRRFAVDYITVPQELHLLHQPDGRYTDQIEFVTLVYDVDGRLLNGVDKTAVLNLTSDTYKRFQQGPVQFHLEVSAPTRQDSYLRIGIHDRNTNRFGVVEVPADAVSRLPPPVYYKPAAPPATSAAPSTAPSTTTPPQAVPPR
jgi:VWFA-related protein